MNTQCEMRFASSKLAVGPGGWSCACCVPMNPKKDKGKIHRMVRRNMKHKLINQVKSFTMEE
jgi:hypothetical protein